MASHAHIPPRSVSRLSVFATPRLRTLFEMQRSSSESDDGRLNLCGAPHTYRYAVDAGTLLIVAQRNQSLELGVAKKKCLANEVWHGDLYEAACWKGD